jgi:hypothetical protein
MSGSAVRAPMPSEDSCLRLWTSSACLHHCVSHEKLRWWRCVLIRLRHVDLASSGSCTGYLLGAGLPVCLYRRKFAELSLSRAIVSH